MKLISLFSGAGGMDLGFKQAGFQTIWANEYDSKIWETFEKNFPTTTLDKRSIVDIPSSDIPSSEGLVGGPPCQSWSEAGARRGINDKRGQLFFEYVRVLKDKSPKFFLAENVSGILHPKNKNVFLSIIQQLEDVGYNVSWKLVNANDYGVPQDRERVIIVGYNKSLNKQFKFPEPEKKSPVLKEAIFDLEKTAMPALPKNKTNGSALKISNHEYMIGGFSTMYMSRNRVRSWDEPSFTIQAGGRHAPIHPQAPKMVVVGKDKQIFAKGKEHLYRRLSVRECARIQTFPDNFEFYYTYVADGYKMIGNAVPPNLAYIISKQISADLSA